MYIGQLLNVVAVVALLLLVIPSSELLKVVAELLNVVAQLLKVVAGITKSSSGITKQSFLAIEAIIGLVVIFFINKGIMKSKRQALITTLIDFTILVVSAILLSLNYINKF